MPRILFVFATVSLALIACKTPEIDDKPAADVQDVEPAANPCANPCGAADAKASEATEMSGAIPDGDKLTVVAAESKISFIGAKVTGTHDGGFKQFSGNAVAKDGAPLFTQFTIQTNSLWADKEKLTGHLQSPDFFDVEKYPTASFMAGPKGFKKGEGNNYEVTGILDLHGVKKVVTFPATITFTDLGAMLKAEFKIKRFDFQLVYPGKPDDLIKDDVAILLDMAFTKG